MNDIKLIAFDLDGTLIENVLWAKAQALVKVDYEEANLWYERYYRREVTFRQMQDHFSEIYRRHPQMLRKFLALNKYIRIFPGVRKTVKKLSAKYRTVIISSGMDFYVAAAARKIGIAEWYANYRLETDGTGMVREIKPQYPDERGKVHVLEKLCKQQMLQPDQIVFIGDSINDLTAFEYTRRGILIGPGIHQLQQSAWKKITKISQLGELL